MTKTVFGAVPPLDKHQKLALAVFGELYLDKRQPPGYRAPVPVYVVNCHVHGAYLDTPHGFKPDQHFHCPECVEEAKHTFEVKVNAVA